MKIATNSKCMHNFANRHRNSLCSRPGIRIKKEEGNINEHMRRVSGVYLHINVNVHSSIKFPFKNIYTYLLKCSFYLFRIECLCGPGQGNSRVPKRRSGGRLYRKHLDLGELQLGELAIFEYVNKCESKRVRHVFTLTMVMLYCLFSQISNGMVEVFALRISNGMELVF